jgi:hypothetical protein
MAERQESEEEPEGRSAASPRAMKAAGARRVLLLGAGQRPREVGAVLSALAALRADGERALEPLSPLGVGDLEELLAQRPDEGLLILESGRVPGEDIGFVRRFLERHELWRLVVLGEEAQDPRARALLALPRAQWLPWPPDLEQLRALAAPGPRGERPASPPARPERRGARRGGAALGAGTPPQGSGVDVGVLLEELLASAALQGESPPRYQFRCPEPIVIPRERSSLIEGLAGLVELARCCAGPDGLVRASVESAGANGPHIGLDFPGAGLPEKELPGLLERAGTNGASELDPLVAQGLAAARRSAAALRQAGGRVELSPDQGRVRCEVHLGGAPAAEAAAPRGAGRPKPEDPFA